MSITQKSAYWKRIGYVEIEGRDKKMRRYGGISDALDFKFAGEKIGDVYIGFSVSILGLSLDTINELTVWNPEEAFTKKRKIRVFAGYEKDGISNPIFDGFVIEAMPTNPPEMWMNFQCMRGFDMNVPVEKDIVVVGTIDKLFGEVLKAAGLNGRINARNYDKKKEYKFQISGTKGNLPEKFASSFGLSAWYDNGTLVLDDRFPWYADPKNAVPVSSETGMLALGNISMKGAVIRRRLDDTAQIGSWVNLRSQIVPKANGNYFVMKKKHVGHFRGDDWYTELDCIRQQKGM